MAVLLVLFLLVAGAAVVVVLWMGRSAVQVAEEPLTATAFTTTLRYDVPEGQDPAAVVAAVASSGLAVTTESAGDLRVVVVALETDSALDREDVRTLIAGAGSTIQDHVVLGTPVRFEDESPGRRASGPPGWT